MTKKHVLWLIHPNPEYMHQFINAEKEELIRDLDNSTHLGESGSNPEKRNRHIAEVFKDLRRIDDQSLRKEAATAFADVLASTRTHDYKIKPKDAILRLKEVYEKANLSLPQYYQDVLEGKVTNAKPVPLTAVVFHEICNNILHAQKENAQVVVELEEGQGDTFRKIIELFNKSGGAGEKIDLKKIKAFTSIGKPEKIWDHVKNVEKFLNEISKKEPDAMKDCEIHLSGFMSHECVATRALILKNLEKIGKSDKIAPPDVRIIGGFSTPFYRSQEPEDYDKCISPRSITYNQEKQGFEFWEMAAGCWTDNIRKAEERGEDYSQDLELLKKIGIFSPEANPQTYQYEWNPGVLYRKHKKAMFETGNEFREQIHEKNLH